jgi:hypothetical protein
MLALMAVRPLGKYHAIRVVGEWNSDPMTVIYPSGLQCPLDLHTLRKTKWQI